jgi:hypothetical protein
VFRATRRSIDPLCSETGPRRDFEVSVCRVLSGSAALFRCIGSGGGIGSIGVLVVLRVTVSLGVLVVLGVFVSWGHWYW